MQTIFSVHFDLNLNYLVKIFIKLESTERKNVRKTEQPKNKRTYREINKETEKDINLEKCQKKQCSFI